VNSARHVSRAPRPLLQGGVLSVASARAGGRSPIAAANGHNVHRAPRSPQVDSFLEVNAMATVYGSIAQGLRDLVQGLRIFEAPDPVGEETRPRDRQLTISRATGADARMQGRTAGSSGIFKPAACLSSFRAVRRAARRSLADLGRRAQRERRRSRGRRWRSAAEAGPRRRGRDVRLPSPARRFDLQSSTPERPRHNPKTYTLFGSRCRASGRGGEVAPSQPLLQDFSVPGCCTRASFLRPAIGALAHSVDEVPVKICPA